MRKAARVRLYVDCACARTDGFDGPDCVGKIVAGEFKIDMRIDVIDDQYPPPGRN